MVDHLESVTHSRVGDDDEIIRGEMRDGLGYDGRLRCGPTAFEFHIAECVD